MNNLEEVNKLLEMYNLPRLNKEEIENVNKLITNNEIKSLIQKLSMNKSSGPDGFTCEFYQTFMEEIIPILLKLFQKLKRKECFQTHV